MSDYTQITDFSAKDALPTGDSEKIILGADFDAEFAALATAISSKYDSGSIASEAQAEALALNTVLITPLRLDNVFKDNAGALSGLQALTDPGADTVYGWDDSAGAAIQFTAGSGILFSGTAITVDHDDATNFVANEHINHTSVSITAGDGLTGGGTIASTRTLDVGAGNGITVNANDVALANQSASSSNPIFRSSGSTGIDLSALTNVEGNDLAATDEILVEDGGSPRAIQIQKLGMRVQSSQTTQTLAAADMNSIMVFTGTATLTVPNSDLCIGAPVVIKNTHATQEVTVDAASGATLDTTNHPGGAEDSDKVSAGGTALLYQTASGTWHLSGDITD